MNVPSLISIAPSLDASRYVEGANKMERANEAIETSTESVDRAQGKLATRLNTSASSVDRLQSSLDKNFAAQAQHERFIERITDAHERGRITDQRRIELLELAQQRYQRATVATTALAAASASAAVSSRQFGFYAQQSSYQIQDFAVQVASGQSAVTAFAQQGSQLLGIFGATGVMAGAALAVGAVAYQFLTAKKNTEEAKDAVTNLIDEVKRLNEETARLTAPTPRLGGRLEIANLQAEIARLRNVPTARPEAGGMMGELGVGNEASAVAAGRAAERIAELEKRLQELTRAEEANRIAVTLSNDAYDYSLSIAELLREQAQERERAAAESARAEAAYNAQLSQVMDSIQADIDRYNRSLDDQARAVREQIDPTLAYARELERIGELYRTNRLTAEEYSRADAQLRERIFRGTQSTIDVTRQLGLTFESAFESAIVRGEKLSNVLNAIGQDIARIIVRLSITEPAGRALQTALGPITAGIGSWFRGLFGGGPGDIRGPGGSTSIPFGGPRALGGPVEAGSAYLVGEQGPELFVPRSSGTVVPNDALGGSSRTTIVNQTIQISAGVAQTVRAEMLALMPRIRAETVAAVADARMRGGSFAAAMGT